MSDVNLSTTDINGEDWILLKDLGKKILFRAESITKSKQRIPDPSGHRCDQAVAEGSVKFRPKCWDISMLK